MITHLLVDVTHSSTAHQLLSNGAETESEKSLDDKLHYEQLIEQGKLCNS